MPSPFPGMDPYLEQSPLWKVFHDWYIRELARLNVPLVADYGCWIDVERDVWLEDSTGETVMIGQPDVLLGTFESYDMAEERGGVATAVATATQVAAPALINEVVYSPEQPGARWQEYLMIRETEEPSRVLAVIELLSPSNKDRSKDGDLYREKRKRWLASRAHFLEIDLLRDGINLSRDRFADLEPTPYFVFLARKTGCGRNEEAYPLRLQDSLPTISLPLSPSRPDLPLDLAPAFRAAFDLTVQRRRITYDLSKVPDPPMSPADQDWMRRLLESQTTPLVTAKS